MNMDIDRIIEGLQGEEIIRNYFIKNKIKHMQVDLIICGKDGKYKLIEIKHQEIFTKGFNCNFDGHGLPVWQIEARLEFQQKTGIEAWLFIIDKKTKIIYFQSFNKLMENEFYDTHGEKPRRIFNISSFLILKI
jgi:hypothetical protein